MNRIVLALLLCATVSTYAEEPSLESRVSALEEKLADEAPAGLGGRWKNGFIFSTDDGAFELRPRVMIQMDAAWYFDEDDVNEALAEGVEEGEEPDEVENGAEFRRSRFGFEGTVYKHLEYEIVYDFSGGDAAPKDVYIGLTDIPAVGLVRIGHQREPFGRVQGSDSQRIFMEKGLQDALAPDRSLGVRMMNWLKNGTMSWSAGAFYLTDDDGSSLGENAYAFTARIAGQPWHDDKKGRRVHVGVAGSYRHPDEEEIDFGARPESHISPDLIGREGFSADEVNLLGTEGAIQLGAFTLLGEYIMAEVDNMDASGNATMDGYFITASYYLTGEHRDYDTDESRFGRLKPKHNFQDGGWGAWEIAGRVSGLDLTDGDPDLGEMQDYTAALNWHLNPVTRIMLNYIFSDAEDAGDVHVVQARLQLDL